MNTYIEPGKLKSLCDAVFSAVREHKRAYLFIDKRAPVRLVVSPGRDFFDGVLTGDEATNFVFVAVYEPGVRTQDILSDSFEALDHIKQHATLNPPEVPKDRPVAAIIVIAFVLGVGGFVVGALAVGVFDLLSRLAGG